jgi:hypothetical protein
LVAQDLLGAASYFRFIGVSGRRYCQLAECREGTLKPQLDSTFHTHLTSWSRDAGTGRGWLLVSCAGNDLPPRQSNS